MTRTLPAYASGYFQQSFLDARITVVQQRHNTSGVFRPLTASSKLTLDTEMSETMPTPDTNTTMKGCLILWGRIDPGTTNEDALNDWWTNEHLPERLCLPGFLRARRYHARNQDSHGDSHEYLALYESSCVEDLASPQYLEALNNPTPKTKQFMPCLAKMTRSACEIVYETRKTTPESAENEQVRYLAIMVMNIVSVPQPTAGRGEELYQGLIRIDRLFEAGATSIKLLKMDRDITTAGSSSKSYDEVVLSDRSNEADTVKGEKIIVLVEFATLPHISGRDGLPDFISDVSQDLTVVQVEYINTYEPICSMLKRDVVGRRQSPPLLFRPTAPLSI